MLDCSFLHDLESYSKQETAAGAKLKEMDKQKYVNERNITAMC